MQADFSLLLMGTIKSYQAGDSKQANLLAGSLARVVPGLVWSRPLCFLVGSTSVASFFRLYVFECVRFFMLS